MDFRAEKLKILQMIGSGKVTVAEGEMLLDALGADTEEKTAVAPAPALEFDAYSLKSFSEASVPPQFIHQASQLPFPNLTTDDILLLWEEQADLATIGQLVKHGLAQRLSTEQIIEVASEGTSRELIATLGQLATPNLEASQLVELMLERIDPEVVAAIGRLELNYLDGHQLVELASEQVKVELLEAVSNLQAADFNGHHLVDLATERIEPETIRALANANIPNLTGDQVVELALEGFDPEILNVWQQINVRPVI